MDYVFAETSLILRLQQNGLLAGVFGIGHDFHVVDIVSAELDQTTRDLVIASGLKERTLSPSEMRLAAEVYRSTPCACVGEAASLIFAEAHHFALLSASVPFSKLDRTQACGVQDYKWIEDAVTVSMSIGR